MQSLKAFQAAFRVEPVKFEFSEFATDGAFTKETVKALKDEGLTAIYLKPLTSEQRANFEASVVGDGKSKRDMRNLYARYVSLCWVDDEGNLIGKADEIGQLRADFVAELFAKVQELNGIGKEADAGKDS